MWRRIVNLFHRKPSPARSEAVEALFVENLSAHERVKRAAESVTRSSDQTRYRLQCLRREIAARTDIERQSRPQPHTSDVRHLVETALARVQPRPEQKG